MISCWVIVAKSSFHVAEYEVSILEQLFSGDFETLGEVLRGWLCLWR